MKSLESSIDELIFIEVQFHEIKKDLFLLVSSDEIALNLATFDIRHPFGANVLKNDTPPES